MEKGKLVWSVATVVAGEPFGLCHDDSPRALEKVSQKVLHPLATESCKANWGCQRTSRAVIGAGTTSWGHRKGAPNNRINTDAALRASANGRSGFAWFLSQSGFRPMSAPRGLCGPLGAGGETDLAHSQLGKPQTGLHPWWKVVAGVQSWLCHGVSPSALEMAFHKVLHPLLDESFKVGRV